MSAPLLTLTLNPAIDQTVTLEHLAPGEVHRALASRSDAGGKGVNVAGCLADWGLPVAVTGVLGADNAAPFAALFAAKGIDDRFIRVAGQTRTNLKLLDLQSGDTTDVNLPGLSLTAGVFAAACARLLESAGPGSLVVLAGSLPGGLTADTYADLTRRLKARGARVVLDASGPALAAALAAGADALPEVLKPNRHELEEWAGRPLATRAEVHAAARALRERGIPMVAVSLGAEGALFLCREGAIHAHAPAVAVASTVGAGDALVAGLVAGLHADAALDDRARLALAFAAGKLTRAGANLPERAEVERLAASVRIERL
jgi:1-phosphofructokinase